MRHSRPRCQLHTRRGGDFRDDRRDLQQAIARGDQAAITRERAELQQDRTAIQQARQNLAAAQTELRNNYAAIVNNCGRYAQSTVETRTQTRTTERACVTPVSIVAAATPVQRLTPVHQRA